MVLTERDAEETFESERRYAAAAAGTVADDTQGDHGRQRRCRQIGPNASVHVRRGEC